MLSATFPSQGELAASNAWRWLIVIKTIQHREWLSLLQSWGLALFGGLPLPVTKNQLSSRVVSVLNQHKATRHLEKGSYEIYSINIHIQCGLFNCDTGNTNKSAAHNQLSIYGMEFLKISTYNPFWDCHVNLDLCKNTAWDVNKVLF